MVVFTSPGWYWFRTHYKITERGRKIKAAFRLRPRRLEDSPADLQAPGRVFEPWGSCVNSGLSCMRNCTRQVLQEVGGDHADFAHIIPREVSRQSVKVDSQLGGGKGVEPLAQKSCHGAGEDITAAGRRHARIAGGVFVQALAVGHDRRMTLQDQNQFVFAGKLEREIAPVRLHLGCLALQEASEFSRMRRDDRGAGSLAEDISVAGHSVEAIRVQHQRLGNALNEAFHQTG